MTGNLLNVNKCQIFIHSRQVDSLDVTSILEDLDLYEKQDNSFSEKFMNKIIICV